MAQRIIPLSLLDLFSSLPIDQNLKPQGRGIAFTGEVPGIIDPPAYLDPSHVAVWYLGYLAAKSESTGEDGREIVLRYVNADEDKKEQ